MLTGLEPSPWAVVSWVLLLFSRTDHGSPVGAFRVHADRVCRRPHGCCGREPQSVHLWAHHPAHVSGAALQLHLHAQRPEPLRPANCCSRHGGTVHRCHVIWERHTHTHVYKQKEWQFSSHSYGAQTLTAAKFMRFIKKKLLFTIL